MTSCVYHGRTACWVHVRPANLWTPRELKVAGQDAKHCMQGPSDCGMTVLTPAQTFADNSLQMPRHCAWSGPECNLPLAGTSCCSTAQTLVLSAPAHRLHMPPAGKWRLGKPRWVSRAAASATARTAPSAQQALSLCAESARMARDAAAEGRARLQQHWQEDGAMQVGPPQ